MKRSPPVRNKTLALKRGDVIIIDFDPQSGKEIMKRRPGLVISPLEFNQKSNLVLICPITTKSRNSPWQVQIPDGLQIEGFVNVDHLKSMDIYSRKAEKVDVAPLNLIEEVLSILEPLVT